MSENQPKYKRILLKLSGEALAGDKKMGLDMPTVTEICKRKANAPASPRANAPVLNVVRSRSNARLPRAYENPASRLT